MPNLTDVLNDEDEPTVEDIALQVCIARDGSNVMNIGATLGFQADDTLSAGYYCTVPNGTWESYMVHADGWVVSFDNGTGPDIVFEVYENAGRLSNRNTGLFWENHQVLASNPNVAGADPIKNIMSLTQTEYDAIGTPDPYTLYIISGA